MPAPSARRRPGRRQRGPARRRARHRQVHAAARRVRRPGRGRPRAVRLRRGVARAGRLRAERLGALHPDLYLAAETDLGAIRTLVDQVGPRVVVVDSVQTVADPELAGAPGGVGQVREVAAQLVRLAKERGVATFLVGQVTKDGAVAGPKTLEHLVDVVLSFEGDQHHPSRLFLSAREAGVPGVACTVSLEGRRPLVTEVQALVAPTAAPMPRRTAQGLDPGRLAILVAVLERRARVALSGQDV